MKFQNIVVGGWISLSSTYIHSLLVGIYQNQLESVRSHLDSRNQPTGTLYSPQVQASCQYYGDSSGLSLYDSFMDSSICWTSQEHVSKTVSSQFDLRKHRMQSLCLVSALQSHYRSALRFRALRYPFHLVNPRCRGCSFRNQCYFGHRSWSLEYLCFHRKFEHQVAQSPCLLLWLAAYTSHAPFRH